MLVPFVQGWNACSAERCGRTSDIKRIRFILKMLFDGFSFLVQHYVPLTTNKQKDPRIEF
jgi:hypothetical protein